MKRVVRVTCVLMILMAFFGCSQLELKKSSESVAPMKTNGDQISYTFYQLPSLTKEEDANRYFNELFQFIKYSETNHKQYILVVDDTVYSDLMRIEHGEMLSSESIYETPASELTMLEKSELAEKYPAIIVGSQPITESYLKAQIYYLYFVLGRTSEFDNTKEYTELDKMEVIKDILGYRYHFLNRYESANVSFIQIVNVRKLTSQVTAESMSVKVPLSNSSKMGTLMVNRLAKYKEPIVLEGVSSSAVNALFNGDIVLKNRVVFIVNSDYTGYTYANGVYNFFLGGTKKFYEYVNHPITVTVEPLNFNQLKNASNSGTLFKDLNITSPKL